MSCTVTVPELQGDLVRLGNHGDLPGRLSPRRLEDLGRPKGYNIHPS